MCFSTTKANAAIGQPPEKKLKNSNNKPANINTSSANATSTASSTITSPSGKGAKENIAGITHEETHGKIKLIPAIPKPKRKYSFVSSNEICF